MYYSRLMKSEKSITRLKRFYLSLSESERKAFMERMSKEHKRDFRTINAWLNGTRSHPPQKEHIHTTLVISGGQLTREDIRPDIF